MTEILGYTAYVYSTTTGQIAGPSDLPLFDPPTWTRQINNNGSWQVKVAFGAGGWSRDQLRGIAASCRFSVAIMWGDYVCQAGPITTYSVDDVAGTVTYAGGGLWTLLNRRLLHNPAWNPATAIIQDPTADQTITGQLWDIAAALVRNSVSWVYRPGSALPIDIPADSGTVPAGAIPRIYLGYDLVSVGQRLQELTQADFGPDVDFAPYKVVGSMTIRHRMVIGVPYIINTNGADVAFDYGTSLQKLSIDGDGSNIATTAWVKGAGNGSLQLSGMATSTTLTDNGWPALDFVDSAHTSATDPAILNGWARADLALYGKSVEAWKATVRADGVSPLGSYDCGYFCTYNLTGHPWQPDGQYRTRLLGMSNGPEANTVTHILHGRGGF